MIKKVGSGAFGEIYKGKLKSYFTWYSLFLFTIGINSKTGDEVAIKLVRFTTIINTHD